MSKNKGITLVALIVTVIVLLILAGIAIAQLTGSGILEKAKFAEEKQENVQKEENTKLEEYTNLINNYEETNNKIEVLSSELFSFTPNDTNWNVENIKQALDYLYNN